MSHRLLVGIAIGALLVAGCGGIPPDPGPSGVPAAPDPDPVLAPGAIADITGPWRPDPVSLNPDLRRRLVEACRVNLELPRNEGDAVVIDARGEGVATVRMGGRHPGQCDAFVISDTGEVQGGSSGWTRAAPEALPGLDLFEIGPLEKGVVVAFAAADDRPRVKGWSVVGRAGPGLTRVVVAPKDRPEMTATLENGWFAAWWPADPGDSPGEPGSWAPPFEVRGYDILGALRVTSRG